MTHSRFSPVVHRLGALVVVAVFALAGCQRNSEPAATAPQMDTTGQSAEYPVVTPAADSRDIPAAGSVKVTVSLSPALAKQARPNDVVFIFARAAQGPRMPLAIVRKQVKDLPATVVLDDSNAMSTEMKLSGVPEVVVVARVSKSGMASAAPGDLEGVSGPVKPGAPAINLSIAKVVAGKAI
jgi:cytochrome c-type biogenesis protein CcmH